MVRACRRHACLRGRHCIPQARPRGIAGRHAREVLGKRRRGVLGHVVAPPQLPQISLPAPVVARGVPHAAIVVHRALGVAPVEHRVERHLVGHAHLAAVAREQTRRHRKTAARALPAHEDLVGGDAQLVGMVAHPEQRRVAVVERCGVRRGIRQPVLRRDGNGLARTHERRHARHVHHRRHAQTVPASVDPEHTGKRRPLDCGPQDERAQGAVARAHRYPLGTIACHIYAPSIS